MTTYFLGDILTGIKDTLGTAASLQRSEDYGELTEGIHDYPLLQVYPENNPGTSRNSETHKLTLSIKHTVKEYTVHADLYAQPRGNDIGESMSILVSGIDEFENILDTQGCPPFGVNAIISFRWSWNRVTFSYGGADYVGARFVIVVRAGTGG